MAHFAGEFQSRLAVAAAAVARYSFSDFSAEFLHNPKNDLGHFAEEFSTRLAVAAAAVARCSFSDFTAEVWCKLQKVFV